MTRENSNPARVESAEPLSLHSRAVLEAGKQLMLQSVETGREFCKAMIGVSFTAIPVYAGLLKLFIPDGYTPTQIIGYRWVVPVLLFVLTSIVAAGGYLPGRKFISLEMLDDVDRVLKQAAFRRFWCGITAFIFLSFGIIGSMAVLGTI